MPRLSKTISRQASLSCRKKSPGGPPRAYSSVEMPLPKSESPARKEEAAGAASSLLTRVAQSSSPPWTLLARYRFVPGIGMNCAQAGTEKFTGEASFGSLFVVGHFTYFGTTTLSGSTGFAPAAWSRPGAMMRRAE